MPKAPIDIQELKFRCTTMDKDPDFNFGVNPCGNSIKVGDIWLCGDKNGRYCLSYTFERCGGAVSLRKSNGGLTSGDSG